MFSYITSFIRAIPKVEVAVSIVEIPAEITSITQASDSLMTKAKYLWNLANWAHPETAYEFLYHAETGLTDVEEYLSTTPMWNEWREALHNGNDDLVYDYKVNPEKLVAILKTIPDEIVKHRINMNFVNWVVNLAQDDIVIPEDMCWTNEDRDEIFRLHKAVVTGTLPLLNVD